MVWLRVSGFPGAGAALLTTTDYPLVLEYPSARSRLLPGYPNPRRRVMPENKAHEVLHKHNISVDDVKERRASLHHLRHIVHAEQLPFDVFKALVKLRR